MGMTRTQRLRQVIELEAAGTIRPDTSRVIAELTDCWSIRSPHTAGDFRREGSELLSELRSGS